MTRAELSQRTGLYKSTLLRLAGALMHHRFLDRLEDGRFCLGSAPFTSGSIYQSGLNLGDVLLPLMRELNRDLGEAVSFHVHEGNHRVCLYRVNSRFAIRPEVRQGDVQSLERGAGGRVLLAFSGKAGAPDDEIRRHCTYISMGERAPETSGLSAPVFGVQQVLPGAIGVVGPVNRLVDANWRRYGRGSWQLRRAPPTSSVAIPRPCSRQPRRRPQDRPHPGGRSSVHRIASGRPRGGLEIESEMDIRSGFRRC